MNERSYELVAGSSPIWFDHRGRSPMSQLLTRLEEIVAKFEKNISD